MWYWDYTPSGGNHAKKPFTKAQLRRIQESYHQADKIKTELRKMESNEQEDAEKLLSGLDTAI
jgi:hypothetical protein